MKWVRGPWWDGFWLLSGLPIGLALVLTSNGRGIGPIIAMTIMVLETAHVVTPIALAFVRRELGDIVLRKPIKCVGVPLALVAASLVAPASWFAGPYFAWNIFHFGMQNFGVLSLYGIIGDRVKRGALCLGVTALGMGLPALVPNQYYLMFGVGFFGFNHWLADIGLSSRVVRWHWGFIVMVLAIGVGWLLLRNGPLSAQLAPQIIAFRYAIGMAHFILESEFWKFSNPRVRATIGKELFA